MTRTKVPCLIKIAFVAVVVLAIGGCGSGPSSEELIMWQDSAAQMTAEVNQIRADLILIDDPVQRAKLQQQLDLMQPSIDLLNDAIQKAETANDAKWNFVETIGLIAAGLIPGGTIAYPLIRSARRTLPAVFDSIAAGGGPKDGDAAKAALAESPAARAAYERWKADQPS